MLIFKDGCRMQFQNNKMHICKRKTLSTPQNNSVKLCQEVPNMGHRMFCCLMRKKFKLYGADGFQHYQHNKNIPPKTFSTQHRGRGSIMIWGSFQGKNKASSYIGGHQIVAGYVGILERVSLLTEDLCENEWTIQRVHLI